MNNPGKQLALNFGGKIRGKIEMLFDRNLIFAMVWYIERKIRGGLTKSPTANIQLGLKLELQND